MVRGTQKMRNFRLYYQLIKWSLLQGYYQAKYERFNRKSDLHKSLAYHDLLVDLERSWILRDLRDALDEFNRRG